MRVLLHICCAVCASSCVERLRVEGYEVTGLFCNSNIQPEAEYRKRLSETEKLSQQQDFPLIISDYTEQQWSARIKGLEKEPEGGRRCTVCFSLRLKQTAKVAKIKGFNFFTTTLTVSPHKDSQLINAIGQQIDNRRFLGRDFKQKDGFKRTQELARQYNLYHQNYCGCIYSKKARGK